MANDNKKATETKQTVPSAAVQELKVYLERRAKRDKAFAEMYANPDKSLAECVQYLKECAKEQAVDNVAFCSSEEVFGWAVHYYNEPDLKPKGNVQATMGATSEKAEKPKSKKPKGKKPEKSEEDELADEIDGMLD